MPVGQKPSLPSEILSKLDVINEVARDLLISNSIFYPSFLHFECNYVVLHFCLYGVHTQCVSICCIDILRFLYAFRDSNSILLCPLSVFGFFLNNQDSFPKGEGNPPCKSWLVLYVVFRCVIS